MVPASCRGPHHDKVTLTLILTVTLTLALTLTLTLITLTLTLILKIAFVCVSGGTEVEQSNSHHDVRSGVRPDVRPDVRIPPDLDLTPDTFL